MKIEEIKTILNEKGYSISPNYGLILEKEIESDFEKMQGPVLADIRISEENVVVLPYGANEKEDRIVSKLKGILLQDEIEFRDMPFKEKK